MSNYLYCIQYQSLNLYKNTPGVIHLWLENHPDDGVIEKYLESTLGKVDEFNYFLVYDKTLSVPFIDEVEEFNTLMGKEWQNRTTPTINTDDANFVINFIQEELDELKDAVKSKDIVGILDALLDITYVGLGNGALVFGLKDKIEKGYAEVQSSNLSKICQTLNEAQETTRIRSEQYGEPCYFHQIGDKYVVYRSSDNKVQKSINYVKPNLNKFFTEEEIQNCKK
jgi:hypothetical protein